MVTCKQVTMMWLFCHLSLSYQNSGENVVLGSKKMVEIVPLAHSYSLRQNKNGTTRVITHGCHKGAPGDLPCGTLPPGV